MKYYEIYSKYLDNLLPDKEQQLVRCIFHDDTNPSLSVNLETGLFNCFACHESGNAERFLQLVGEKVGVTYIEELVERYHKHLIDNNRFLKFLMNTKHISLETIIERKIGYDEVSGRYVIPVYDLNMKLVGVRKYKPYATSQKIIQFGDSFPCYPADMLLSDTLVITEGEMDALALISHGIHAITLLPPSGLKNVDEIAEHIHDKQITICYDNDSTGRKLSFDVLHRVAQYTSKVKNINLEPYKDVCDFLANKGIDELLRVLHEQEYFFRSDEEDISKLRYLPVSSLIDIENLGKKFLVDFYIASRSVDVYHLPRRFNVICNPVYNMCDNCPLKPYGGTHETVLSEKNYSFFVGMNDLAIRRRLKQYLHIPTRCNIFSIEPTQNELLTVANVTNRIDEKVLTEVNTMIRFYIVTEKDTVEANRMYRGVVQVEKSSRTNEIIGIARNIEPLNYQMDYELTPAFYDLNPKGSQNCYEKYLEIVEDLEYIVNVNERRDLIMALDLLFHSALTIQFERRKLKGYMDILIIGDTRTGKSSVAKGLINFYGLGEMVDGSNVSFAGLIGGVNYDNEALTISWGVIPQNDARLVIIDEADELSGEILEKLSYVRSSGIAELTKIYRNKTNARVRLAMITNPPQGTKISDYTYPILAVEDFAKSKQDIARFDFVHIVTGNVSTIRVTDRPLKHDPDVLRNLVRFAWTLKEEDIFYAFDMDTLLNYCDMIAKDYTDILPLIEKNSVYEKVLRIATAAAIRLFSYDANIGKVIVTEDHLDFAITFLSKLYENSSNGYYSYSQLIKTEESRFDKETIRSAFTFFGDDDADPVRALAVMRQYTTFSKSSLKDAIGLEQSNYDRWFAMMLTCGVFRRLSNGLYTKTELFERVEKFIIEEIKAGRLNKWNRGVER